MLHTVKNSNLAPTSRTTPQCISSQEVNIEIRAALANDLSDSL